MRLVLFDKEQTGTTSKNTYQEVMPRRPLKPVRDRQGRTHWYWGDLWVPLPRRLNWLWRRLAG